jgi:hypothetical protein
MFCTKQIQNLSEEKYLRMIFTIRNHKALRKIAAGIFAVLFWVGVWQAVYLAVGQEILVASPAQVWKRLLELVAKKEFWLNRFLLPCAELCRVSFGVCF